MVTGYSVCRTMLRCSTFGPPRNRPGDGVLPNQEYSSSGFDNYQNTARSFALHGRDKISIKYGLHSFIPYTAINLSIYQWHTRSCIQRRSVTPKQMRGVFTAFITAIQFSRACATLWCHKLRMAFLFCAAVCAAHRVWHPSRSWNLWFIEGFNSESNPALY